MTVTLTTTQPKEPKLKHDPENMSALAKALRMDPTALAEVLAETGVALVTDTSAVAARKKAKAEARAKLIEYAGQLGLSKSAIREVFGGRYTKPRVRTRRQDVAARDARIATMIDDGLACTEISRALECNSGIVSLAAKAMGLKFKRDMRLS